MINSFSQTFKLIFLLMILSVNIFISCDGDSTQSRIIPAENYPRWLLNDQYHTNQTSGITFLSESDDGTMKFLLADDIGKIHRFFIKDDTVFSIFGNKI